jgi:amino acid adenylation domain-containing protein
MSEESTPPGGIDAGAAVPGPAAGARPPDEVAQRAFWRAETAAAVPPRLVVAPAAADPGVTGFALDAAVGELARSRGVTADAVPLAALLALLHRLTLQDQVVIGVEVDPRPAVAGRPLGEGTAIVPLRVDATADTPFAELLDRAAAALARGRAHPSRAGVALPAGLLDIVYAPLDPAAADLPPGADAAGERVRRAVRPDGDRYAARLAHGRLLDRPTAARWAVALGTLLTAAAARPATRLGELPLRPAPEQAAVAAEINSRVEAYPGLRPVHEAFTRVARDRPDLIAVEGAGAAVTYGELDARSAALAGALTAAGIGPERRVGVLVERSAELIVAVLAAWRAGAAVVPLDPRMPARRIALIAADAGLATILTQERFRELLSDQPAPLTVVGAAAAPVRPVPVSPDHAAYVYYTSGSTGEPKGVVLDHRTAAGRLAWLAGRYGLAAGDRVVHKTPLIFDVAIWEILGPLSAGATILLADPGGESDVDHIGALLARDRTVFTHFVPSMLDAFLQLTPRRDYPTLRWVQLSGEAVPARLLVRYAGHFDAEFHNMYGQTETSEVAAWEGRSPTGDHAVPIGRQIGIYRLYVLDEALVPVPVGVPGELCVAGLGGLARGYHRRPGLTAERFVPNPYPLAPGERLYRTGDLATVDADGVLTYRGRLDGQTKIRGCRVETDEVEAVLAQAGVDCAVVARPDDDGRTELVAYVVGNRAAVPRLAAHAERELPGYMLPAVYVPLPALPLGTAGKLDRRRLPAPTAADRSALVAGEAPLSALESRLHDLWAAVLGLDRIGRTDNFFAVGGNSLKSLQVLNRVNAAFGIRFAVSDFFGGPTIAEMAATARRLVGELVADLSDSEAERLLGELTGGGRK